MFPTLISTIGALSMLTQALFAVPTMPVPQAQVLATKTMNLQDRYAVPSVNDVFKDNILLTLAYLRGAVANADAISWNQVEAPFTYSFSLKPGETFAFHDDVLPEFANQIVKTTQAHFNFAEGFKSDGYLTGDGVCHLASLLSWVSKDAGLAVKAPTAHDFAVIPDVPKQYGVAIYDAPGKSTSNELQNLYVTNNKDHAIAFVFTYQDNTVKVHIEEKTDL